MKPRNNSHLQGFSTVELLIVVAVIAVMAGIGIGLMTNTHGNVKAAKLKNDVKSLNEAIQVFRSNGGSMDGVTTVGAALDKLKTRADSKRVVGLRGSMLDARYEAHMLTSSESLTTQPRALWSEARQRFVLATSGNGGAERFYINEDAADEVAQVEARETAMEYGTNDWVWDYVSDASLAPSAGVGSIATNPATYGGYTPVVASNATQLDAPSISVPGGIFGYYEFGLQVELIDPNPVGSSQLFYSLNNNFWHVYSGAPIEVAPNQTLTAYSVSTDAEAFSDSPFISEHYASTFTISGTAGGDFLNPEGTENLVTNLADGESSSYFTFGTPATTVDPSWLLFNGANFNDVSADESFLLGSIDYYNGTIYSGTGADSVGLSISLGFDGGVQSLDFDFALDLISTPNLEGNTPEESADFVKLDNINSDVPVELGGVAYNLILEFGETTAGGFSSIDEFHVIEGQAASGSLYGRLVEATEEEAG